MTKKSILAALAAILLVNLAGCRHQEDNTAASAQISKCTEELNRIKPLSEMRKSRSKAEVENQKPFEGMELALTINEMVTSRIDDRDVDDLCYSQDTRENFDKLVKALVDNHMPPTVDFVEGVWFDRALQTDWLKSGNLVGNLTYDRRKAKRAHGQELIDIISKNDQILSVLWQSKPEKKYFRYPHPRSLEHRDHEMTNDYLQSNGYIEVPVTIETPEEDFAQIYCGALAKGNTECASLIKANFFSLLLDQVIKSRAEFRETTGREVKHILAVRASQLTCDTLGEMVVWFKGFGAKFISLDEALADPYYSETKKTPQPSLPSH